MGFEACGWSLFVNGVSFLQVVKSSLKVVELHRAGVGVLEDFEQV